MVQRLPPHKVRCGGRNSQGELNKEKINLVKTRDVLVRVYKGNTMKGAHSSLDQYLLSVWYMTGIILEDRYSLRLHEPYSLGIKH